MGVSRERAETLGQVQAAPLILKEDSLVARSNAIWMRSQ